MLFVQIISKYPFFCHLLCYFNVIVVFKYFELRIYEFEDCCWHYENKQYDVDVFYGNKKIIIVIRTKKRESMIVNLETKSRWIKVPKIKD